MQNPSVFSLKQNPDIDQWWPLILFLSVFVAMAIWGNETTWLRDYVIGAWAVAVILGFVLWRKARCTLIADEIQLTIEITKAGYRKPLGKSSFDWQDLIHFEFDGGGESEDTIILKWSDGISQTFSGRDLKAFYAYLKKHFPGKERRY